MARDAKPTPEARQPVRKIQITSDGLVYDGELLKVGSIVTVPANLADRWVGSGRAAPTNLIRVRLLSDCFFGRGSHQSGEELVVAEPVALRLYEAATAVILNPSALQSDLSRVKVLIPTPTCDPWAGVRRIKAFAKRAFLLGARCLQSGESIELPEPVAVKHVGDGVLELAPGEKLDPQPATAVVIPAA